MNFAPAFSSFFLADAIFVGSSSVFSSAGWPDNSMAAPEPRTARASASNSPLSSSGQVHAQLPPRPVFHLTGSPCPRAETAQRPVPGTQGAVCGRKVHGFPVYPVPRTPGAVLLVLMGLHGRTLLAVHQPAVSDHSNSGARPAALGTRRTFAPASPPESTASRAEALSPVAPTIRLQTTGQRFKLNRLVGVAVQPRQQLEDRMKVLQPLNVLRQQPWSRRRPGFFCGIHILSIVQAG